MRFVEAIQEDIKWLGFEWDELHFASDYFDQLYAWAVTLIKQNKAYVDTQAYEEIKGQRGTLTKPGENSPHRERPTRSRRNEWSVHSGFAPSARAAAAVAQTRRIAASPRYESARCRSVW